MPLIDFFCENCKQSFSELVDINDDKSKIVCPRCKKIAKQKFNGKCFGKIGSTPSSGGCSGNCGSCSGCH